MKQHIPFFLLSAFTWLLLASCSNDDLTISDSDTEIENDPVPVDVTAKPPNILLIIGDDIGKDAFPGYIEGSVKPNTPHINALAQNGILFNQFYTYPTCSPTRATILTGKYGIQTGVTYANQVLNSSETVLQDYINSRLGNAYNTAVIGKWHLAGDNDVFNPETLGIDHYAGGVGLDLTNYYDWTFTEDGQASKSSDYLTTTFTDLGIDWLQQQRADRPWFLWMAHFTAHTPFHLPPTQMHGQGNLPADNNAIRQNPLPYYMAMIESLDYEIGRLLAEIPEDQLENTVIIFIGDNGTPGQVAQAPFSRNTAKQTLYQGGINCPMIISGKGIAKGLRSDALIQATDLFATIASIAGVPTERYEQSYNFHQVLEGNATTSQRPFVYVENFSENSEWAIIKNEYKLIQDNSNNELLFHLTNDPFETQNLLEMDATDEIALVKADLETEIARIRE